MEIDHEHKSKRQILSSDFETCSPYHHTEPAKRCRQLCRRGYAELCWPVIDFRRVACIQLCKRSFYGFLWAGHRGNHSERPVLGPEGYESNPGDRGYRTALFPADRTGLLCLRPVCTEYNDAAFYPRCGTDPDRRRISADHVHHLPVLGNRGSLSVHPA